MGFLVLSGGLASLGSMVLWAEGGCLQVSVLAAAVSTQKHVSQRLP